MDCGMHALRNCVGHELCSLQDFVDTYKQRCGQVDFKHNGFATDDIQAVCQLSNSYTPIGLSGTLRPRVRLHLDLWISFYLEIDALAGFVYHVPGHWCAIRHQYFEEGRNHACKRC